MLCAATAATAAATSFAAGAPFCGRTGAAAAGTAAFGTAEPNIEARLAGSKAGKGNIPSPAGVAVRPG